MNDLKEEIQCSNIPTILIEEWIYILPDVDFKVLVHICNKVFNNTIKFFTSTEITKRTGITSKRVKTSLRRLIDRGIIVRNSVNYKVNSYSLYNLKSYKNSHLNIDYDKLKKCLTKNGFFNKYE